MAVANEPETVYSNDLKSVYDLEEKILFVNFEDIPY
jgi:hypothetical protein